MRRLTLEGVPGRFLLAYGNIQAGPWQWATRPEFKEFVSRRVSPGNEMLGFQMAFDVTGDLGFPEIHAPRSTRTRTSGSWRPNPYQYTRFRSADTHGG